MNKFIFILAFLTALCLPTKSVSADQEAVSKETKPIVGWVEKIKLYPGECLMQANLLPEIRGSSIHTDEIKTFTRKKKKWVRFTLTDIYGEKITLERERVRLAKVKKSSGEVVRYPVVQLGICLGELYIEGELKLTDRSERKQRVAIGREILAGNILIDPAISHTLMPNCKNIPEDAKELD